MKRWLLALAIAGSTLALPAAPLAAAPIVVECETTEAAAPASPDAASDVFTCSVNGQEVATEPVRTSNLLAMLLGGLVDSPVPGGNLPGHRLLIGVARLVNSLLGQSIFNFS
ncbi:MAG TPA: hypothetical protein VHS99_11125 [Chloroflexota bacterium]|jgi:hypothetical protein|nr:hypothetical protein [Chloroflexota bacterium]